MGTARPVILSAARRLALLPTWPVWALPPFLRSYVLAVIATAAAVTAAGAAQTPWRPGQGILFGLLLGFCVLNVESLRKVGEPAGSVKDAHGVWQTAVALLLPPVYSIAGTIAVFAFTHARVRTTFAYRRVFSTAAIALSYAASSALFHAMWRGRHVPPRGLAALGWIAAALVATLVRWLLNNYLVLGAVKLTSPAARILDLLGGREGVFFDVAEGLIGILIALAVTVTPWIMVLATPCGIVLQRFSRHKELLRATRIEGKTKLLTATAWQAEADIQIAEARRTGQDLAVLMIDLDHFKLVNDRHGHLAGDRVLVVIAERLRASVRPYDLAEAGRWGGEELCLLLPGTGPAAAAQVAERLRQQLGGTAINLGELDPEVSVEITVSIGLATLTETASSLLDLLAAADGALYAAKDNGRDMAVLAAADGKLYAVEDGGRNLVRLAGQMNGARRPGR